MRNNEYILWLTSLILCLCIGSSLEVSGTRKRRSLRLQNNRSNKVLAKLSDMETFKDLELNAFNKERVSGTAANKEVQEHIKRRLLEHNWEITEDTFEDSTPLGTKTFTNIIANSPKKYDVPDRLVLAAHYDSKYFQNMNFIGATDSAVPCAILLDIARTLDCLFLHEPSESGKNLTVQLLFLDGEEAFKHWTADDSLYGARHLAKVWSEMDDPFNKSRKYIDGIKDFVLLDLIGTSDTRFNNIVKKTKDLYEGLTRIENELFDAKLLKRQESKNYLHSRNRLFPPVPAFDAGIQDDHIPFQQKGVPILHLISYPFPSVWHKQGDNFSSLDYDLIDDFMKIFRVFVTSYMQYKGTEAPCANDVVNFDDGSGEENRGWWWRIADYIYD